MPSSIQVPSDLASIAITPSVFRRSELSPLNLLVHGLLPFPLSDPDVVSLFIINRGQSPKARSVACASAVITARVVLLEFFDLGNPGTWTTFEEL
jgi:hypothetical protein